MWNYVGCAAILSVLSSFQVPVESATIVELQILSFSNPLSQLSSGDCCSGTARTSQSRCLALCWTAFSGCVYSPGGACTGAHVRTGVLGRSSFGVASTSNTHDRVVSRTIAQRWEGGIAMDLEALHQPNSSTAEVSVISEFQFQFDNVQPDNIWSDALTHASSSPGQSQASAPGQPELSVRVRARCAEGWYGPGCATECRPNPRFHLACDHEGRTVCAAGWSGRPPACNQFTCSGAHACLHGRCIGPNTCRCHPGYTGRTCSTCLPSPSCRHGTCSTPFSCSCFSGWGGADCHIDLEVCTRQRPCLNGGVCRPPPTVTSMTSSVTSGGVTSSVTSSAQYTCECPPGYTGRNCEVYSGCEMPGYCLNGGQCPDVTSPDATMTSSQVTSGDARGSKVCTCAAGWSGHRCERVASCAYHVCANDGQCVEAGGQGGPPRCVCKAGFVGADCGVRDPCAVEDACLNGGVCSTNPDGSQQCACPPGLSGARCQTKLADPVVDPRVSMVDPRVSMVDPRVSMVDPCEGHDCRNGAPCRPTMGTFSYTCACLPGFSGTRCEISPIPPKIPRQPTTTTQKQTTTTTTTAPRKVPTTPESIPEPTRHQPRAIPPTENPVSDKKSRAELQIEIRPDRKSSDDISVSVQLDIANQGPDIRNIVIYCVSAVSCVLILVFILWTTKKIRQRICSRSDKSTVLPVTHENQRVNNLRAAASPEMQRLTVKTCNELSQKRLERLNSASNLTTPKWRSSESVFPHNYFKDASSTTHEYYFKLNSNQEIPPEKLSPPLKKVTNF